MDIELEKKQIREVMRKKLRDQSVQERKNKSTHIAAKLKKDSGFLNAKTILFYMNTEEEVETEALIRDAQSRKVKIVLPFSDQKNHTIKTFRITRLEELQVGSYGIREPNPLVSESVALSEIDLVIVPGIAFDESRYRLGRGKGYYDRFLAKLPHEVKTFGLAYDFQMVKSLPVTELDFPVSRIFHN